MLRIETRSLGRPLSIADSQSALPKIHGYAAVFNQPSEDMGGFREIVLPGAFAEAIRADDVRALVNHDENLVLGRTSARTLRLVEDQRGLYVEITPPDTQYARDLIAAMRRGDVTQMSFAFTFDARGRAWAKLSGGLVRSLRKVERLFDVSVVTMPAFPQTSAWLNGQGN